MTLRVEFAGEVREVDDRLTFGRAGDLEVDSNPYMHRLVGEFVLIDEVWWLCNVGSRQHLTVVDVEGKRAELPPGTREALLAPGGVVRFEAGRSPYELTYERDDPEVAEEPGNHAPGTATLNWKVRLTQREVDFLVTFARPLLLATGEPLPTYAEVARVWGVSPKTLDNTLQGFKRKLREARLAGDEPLEALLVLLIRHDELTLDDLQWADLDGTPRPAGGGPRFVRG